VRRRRCAIAVLELDGAATERGAVVIEELEGDPGRGDAGGGAHARWGVGLARARASEDRSPDELGRGFESDERPFDECTGDGVECDVGLAGGGVELRGELEDGVSLVGIGEGLCDRGACGRVGPADERVGPDERVSGAVGDSDDGDAVGQQARHRVWDLRVVGPLRGRDGAHPLRQRPDDDKLLRVRCECGLTRYRVLARNASRYAWAAEV